MESESLCELMALRNIGERSARWLLETGIDSRDQIESLGAVEVYRRLRSRHPVSRTMLWALQGALLDLPWHGLPQEMKRDLLAELGEI